MKDCLYIPKNSKKDYNYDEFRAYLLRNHAWWSSTAKELAPAVLAYKESLAQAPEGAVAAAVENASKQPVSEKKVAQNKAVLSKATQRIKAGFDAITKAMGIKTKIEFLTEDQAKKMLATNNGLKKLIGGYNMSRNDLRIALSFGIANELESRGVDKRKIRLQTGWEKGVDGEWKYEIPDAKVDARVLKVMEGQAKKLQEGLDNGTFNEWEDGEEGPTMQLTMHFTLEELIGKNHPLFGLYPDAKKLDISIQPPRADIGPEYNGMYMVAFNNIQIIPNENISLELFNKALGHEIQHFIQRQEGFAQGGNPDNVKIYSDMDATTIEDFQWMVYNSLAGEIEAENVANRIGMSPEEKLQTLLEETENIPRIQQIVVKGFEPVEEGVNFTIGYNGDIKPLSGKEEDIDWKTFLNETYLKSPDGKILGFVNKKPDGTYQVYIDPTVVGPETAIHEIAGHIFLPIIKQVAPELYNKGVELIKGSEYESRLPRLGYKFKTKAETAEEALAQAIGDRGSKLKESTKTKFVEWLKTMWQKVGDILKINISPEKLQDMTLGQFADFIAGSIVYGQEISEMEATPLVAPPGNTTMSTEQAQQLVDTSLSDIYLDSTMRDPEMARMRDAYITQAAGKIAAKGKVVMEALKEDVRDYLTKGLVGIQKYTGAAKEFIKTMGDKVKKSAIIAVIAASSIVGTMKAMASENFTAAANSVKTELVNLGVLSKSVANESFATIKAEIQKAYQTTEKPVGQEPSPYAPVQALFFGLAIPIATRKRILLAIRGKDMAEATEAALNILQEDNISEDVIDPLMSQIEERYEAKSEAEHLADHIERLRAAQRLTPAQAKQLLQHFRNFLQSEEDLNEAIEFVNKLAEKKNMMEKLAAAKSAFLKLKSLRNSKKLTIYDRVIARSLATPRFYLLDEAELDMLADMAKDFYNSRLSEKKPKYTKEELEKAFAKFAEKKPKSTGKKRKTKTTTISMLQFKVEEALKDFAAKLPLAKDLLAQDLSVIGKDKDTLTKILNALKAYDETGIVYDLGGVYEMVRALNDAKKIRNSPIISNLRRLAPGAISSKLQFKGINADEIRRILFGGWDRNAARVTAENNRQRLDIDVKFSKLNISLADRFILGAYSFFKEDSGNQLPRYKASVLANQMNELKNRIFNAKNFGSNSETVGSFEHYYNGATAALSQLGIIKQVNNQWVANPGFETGDFGVEEIESQIPNNILEAWTYSREILNQKHEAYLEALQAYHGRDYDQIEHYWPRTFIRTAERVSDLQDTSVQLPQLGNLGEEGVRQGKEVAARNKGRSLMPNSGGFYVLDGYETLLNGLWDINATTNLSKEYAYTNALINLTTLLENQETNTALKQFIVSSIKGILRDPLVFADTRANWEKAASIMMDAATSTVLNNFQQILKQPTATLVGFTKNPQSSFAAVKLLAEAIKNPQLKEALDKFFNNTSEPYTSQLSHIELETAYRVQPNKYVKTVVNGLEFLNPKSLIAANRFTQRVLLLSEYLAARGYTNTPNKIIEDAAKGFDGNALAAAENLTEAANSTANRHFLPMELKDAKAMKKFLYFLGTYTFVGSNTFFTNLNIWRSPGYTEYQKKVAITHAVGYIVAMLGFQVMLKALGEGLKELGRDLDWLEEEDPEKKKERRSKYYYQVPSQTLFDISTGWLPSFWAGTIQLTTNGVIEYLQDGFANEENVPEKVEAIFKKSFEYPGALGIIGPVIEGIVKAVETKDEQYINLTLAQAAAMAMKLGDAYLILKLKAQAVKSILSAEGNEDVFKQMRIDNPAQFKSYVDEVRRAGVPDAVLHYMAYKDGMFGYYVPASNAKAFYKAYEQTYEQEYNYLKRINKYSTELKLKQAARNSAGMITQNRFPTVRIILPEK